MRHCGQAAAEPLAGRQWSRADRCRTAAPAELPRDFYSPLQTIREDFGTTRVDHIFSAKDSLNAAYTIDDGGDVTATVARSVQHGHRQPARAGAQSGRDACLFADAAEYGAVRLFPRGLLISWGSQRPVHPPQASRVLWGACRWARWSLEAARHRTRPRNSAWPAATTERIWTYSGILYTYEDQVTLTRGKHQFGFGVWFQQFQSNEILALSQYGQASFSGINALLGGVVGTFTYDPAPTEMNWRSLFAAWYAEDTIRVTPQADVDAGFPRRILDRMERGPRPGRQLLLHEWGDQFRSACGELRFQRQQRRSSCRSRESAWRGARSARRR